MPINDGGSGGGGGSGVGTLGGLGVFIASKVKKKPKPFRPWGTPNSIFKTQQILASTEAKIAEAVRLGNPVSDADLRRVETLNNRIEKLSRRFETQQRKNPRAFARAGIAAGATLEQLLAIIPGTSRGQQILERFSSPVFNPAPLPTTGGTSTMPFVVTPSGGGGGGFGGFLDSMIGAGTRALTNLISPPPRSGGMNQPTFLPGFQQASLMPMLPGAIGAVRGLLPSIGGIGAGAVGGEMADWIQNLLGSGGASTLDDSAAFTDPVPGSCRPKPHVKLNPCTGKGTWFVPRGRPLVYSGDLAACRRVDRVAKRLTKSMPRRKAACTTRRKR